MPLPIQRPSSDYMRFLSNTFITGRDDIGPALNVNTLNEVPNSSWFQNRHGAKRMALPELRQGAGDGLLPDTSAAFEVEKIVSVRPVLQLVVRDTLETRYTVRFDTPEFPVLSTAAGVTANRAYHALGYNVPAMSIIHLQRGDLKVTADGSLGPADIGRLLETAAPLAGGGAATPGLAASSSPVYRAAVYRIPEPVVRRLGPFRFIDTRPDDGNDIFPHQRRRELRGLHVAAAWLNHTGIRATRTLDVVVRQEGRTFVRHYLYNTFESLGSGLTGPKEPWMGREHLVELNPVLMRMGTLGLSGGDWVNIEYPDVPHVGRFGAEQFRPEAWQPEHPNPAFARRDSADTFWMARKIAAFTDKEIRHLVKAAAYPEQASEDYVTTVLAQRRDSIAAAYLGFGGGVDQFRVSGDSLHFVDVLRRHVPGLHPASRFVQWHRFSNQENRVTDALGGYSVRETAIPIPEGHAAYVRARITTPGYGYTNVYLRRTARASSTLYEVVGVERGG